MNKQLLLGLPLLHGCWWVVKILYPEKHPKAGGNYAVYFEDPVRIKVEVVAP